MSERDVEILNNILKYCKQIDEANRQFNSNRDSFEENSVYRNSVAIVCLADQGTCQTSVREI